jgi:hypothetical protein
MEAMIVRYDEVVCRNVSLEDEIKNRKDKNRRLKRELEHREGQVRGYETAQEGIQRHLDSTLELLDRRTSELRAAQIFLSTEDSRSVTDVVQLIQDLNSEIVQASASLVESVSLEVIQGGFDEGEMTKSNHEVTHSIGSLALNLLKSVRGEEDMELLEVVFRGCMVAFVCVITQSWHFKQMPEGLDKMYEMIYSEGRCSHLILGNV